MPLAAGRLPLAEIDESALAELDRTDGEAVVSIWYGESAFPADRVDFMSWPDGAVSAEHPMGSVATYFVLIQLRTHPKECTP